MVREFDHANHLTLALSKFKTGWLVVSILIVAVSTHFHLNYLISPTPNSKGHCWFLIGL